MIPVPQYPLYTATITMCNGKAVPYYLNEDKGWAMEIDELKRSVTAARVYTHITYTYTNTIKQIICVCGCRMCVSLSVCEYICT